MAQLNYTGATSARRADEEALAKYQRQANTRAVQGQLGPDQAQVNIDRGGANLYPAPAAEGASEMRQQAELERDRALGAEGQDEDEESYADVVSRMGQRAQETATPGEPFQADQIEKVDLANEQYQGTLEELSQFRKRLMGR